MSVFSDALAKSMPYIRKSWDSSYLPQAVQKPSADPPAAHTQDKHTDAKERGFDDPQLIIKMQQLAMPVGSSNPASGGGDVSSMANALTPPNTSWNTKNG